MKKPSKTKSTPTVPAQPKLSPYMERQKKWMEKYVAALRDGIIVDASVKVEGDEIWPVLVVIPADGGAPYEVTISRDEEGNGPGFLFGLPRVTVE